MTKTGDVLRKLKAMPSRNPHLRKGQVLAGDRYVSIRSEEQFHLANHLFTNSEKQSVESPATKLERRIKLKSMRVRSSEDLDSSVCSYRKILHPALAFNKSLPDQVHYSSSAPSIKRSRRYVAKSPERILDAPRIMDDFSDSSLADWGFSNVVAVALGPDVYVWDANKESSDLLVSFDEVAFPTSVKWSQDGRFLSIGLSDGRLMIYDVTRKKCLRTISSQEHRIGCTGWLRNGIISYGTCAGKIYHHDVRESRSLVSLFDGHSGSVCGLKWSEDDHYLTSGGSDSMVKVWEKTQVSANCSSPIYDLKGHKASVKAIQYVPFLGYGSNIVATGGGLNDHTVKLWNLNNGRIVSSQDTYSQVSGILFSKSYKEMITGHSYPFSGVKVWRYNSDGAKPPSFEHIADLKNHGGGVLGLCQNPDGSYIMSSSDDETMRFWYCWQHDSHSQLDCPDSSFFSSFCATGPSAMSDAVFRV